MPTLDLSALTPEKKEELRIRLEERGRYNASSEEEKQRIIYSARLEADFPAFVREAWPLLEPGNSLSWSWHYDLISEYLTLAYQKKIKRLLINISPRTLKSLITTIMFPVWVWTKSPNQSFVCASYAQGLSEEHSVKRRRLLESDWFLKYWGDRIWLAKDQNQKSKYQNNFEAQMIATSVGGTATGLGGNFLIVDDGLKPDEIASVPAITSLHGWFDNTWRSRLNNAAEDVMIVIEQRTGELDLTGHCLDADKILVDRGEPAEWTHLCLPLEADEDAVDPETLTQRYCFPISGHVKERPLGDVLQPDRFPPATIQAKKILRLTWATQYQQRPSPLEGNLIKRSEIRFYGGMEPGTENPDRDLPAKFDLIVVSADCAFKDEKTSDYVAIGTVGTSGPDRFILEIVNRHLDATATEREILRQKQKWRAHTVLVEDKANGPAVIKNLKRKIGGVVAIEPMGGKMSRMYAMAGEWQGGNWFMDRNAAWSEQAIEQLIKFPAAKYDDIADLITQAAIWLQSKGYQNGFVQFIKQTEAQIAMAKAGRFKQPTPKTLEDAVETTDHVAPVEVPTNGTEKVAHTEVAKPATDDKTKRCEACGSTLMQRIPGGFRCGQCGVQTGRSATKLPVYDGVVRK